MANDREKEIIIESMRFLVENNRVVIFAFVLMNNHMHLLWQRAADHRRADVQRDFLKFTGQQIIKNFRNDKSGMLSELLVGTKDRTYQVWERNSLNVELWSEKVTQ